jgi:hypothetical protein
MPIEHCIRQLVEEALDSDRTPGEVCRDCPELLGEVRRQWERVRAVEAEMEALFPRPDGPPRMTRPSGTRRPAYPGSRGTTWKPCSAGAGWGSCTGPAT